MLVIYDETHLLHDPVYELYEGKETASPEVPDRIEAIRTSLQTINSLTWTGPQEFPDSIALALHPQRYSEYLRSTTELLGPSEECVLSNFIHDTYAPVVNGTWQAARGAINTALTGAQAILQKEHTAVYALCRPPGHHAGDAYMGGYCFFNNAGAATHYLSQQGRVAILDIDYHHGNGTQQLFYDRSDVQYVSIHADPASQYPYTHGFSDEIGSEGGAGYTRNFPIQKNCGWSTYQQVLRQALETITAFAPDFLVVSLGFDGYIDDPIAGFGLTKDNYEAIAHAIASLDMPTLLVQEGGYCVEALGDLAQRFVRAFK